MIKTNNLVDRDIIVIMEYVILEEQIKKNKEFLKISELNHFKEDITVG